MTHPIDVLADVNATLAVIECLIEGVDRKIDTLANYKQSYADVSAIFCELGRQISIVREPVTKALREHDEEIEVSGGTASARALANRVAQHLADSGGKPETPESLLAQGLECDAELLRMALGVLGK